MSQSPGFVDLRIQGAGHGSHTDDSVWPSFTDIMTVIVMIFLMALAVILIKNTELVTQLEDSVRQERQAAELARSQSEKRQTLEKRLTDMERQIAEIKLRLFNTQRERDEKTRQLGVSQDELESVKTDFIALQALKSRLEQERDRLVEANRSLGSELSATEQSEQALTEEKRKLAIEINALESLRDRLKSELEMLAAQNVRLQEQNTALTEAGDKLELENQGLSTQVASLEQDKSSLAARTEELTLLAQNLGDRVSNLEKRNINLRIANQETEEEFDSLQAIYSALQTENLSLEERIEKAGERLAEITRQLEEQGQELALTEENLEIQTLKTESIQTSLTEITEDFTDLQARYLELVGPARSELDRVVAEIRYTKRNGYFQIQYRGPGEAEFRPVNRSELDRLLGLLNQKHPKDVYTRIIIPDDSGLTYNEAWSFTNDILSRYDYYRQ